MKRIGIHLGLVAVSAVLLILITLWGLRSFTNHGAELVTVPNLEGDLSMKALNKLKALNLDGQIIDTTFKDGAKKLSVISQNPDPGRKVKPGRKVYIVINTNKVPMVMMPKLSGSVSFDLAKDVLKRRHLKLGRVTRVVDPSVHGSSEIILRQYEGGTDKPVKENQLIERNSVIDIVVGVSQSSRDSSYNQLPIDAAPPTPDN